MRSWNGWSGEPRSPTPPWPGSGCALAPGIREYQLAGAIEISYLADGGGQAFYYLASTPMSTPTLRTGPGAVQSGDPGR